MTSTSSDFDYNSVTNEVGQSVDQLGQQITNTAQTGDMNDPNTLMQIQQETAEWSAMVTMESNMIKAIGDALKAVAQNTGS